MENINKKRKIESVKFGVTLYNGELYNVVDMLGNDIVLSMPDIEGVITAKPEELKFYSNVSEQLISYEDKVLEMFVHQIEIHAGHLSYNKIAHISSSGVDGEITIHLKFETNFVSAIMMKKLLSFSDVSMMFRCFGVINEDGHITFEFVFNNKGEF